jgi:DNA-binding transcriptional ArsR family regulator
LIKIHTLPLEQLAAILGSSEYEAMKYLQTCKDGIIPVAFTHPKKEETKAKTISKIVKNLPATQAVLSRRSGLSKSVVNRYLKKLVDHEIVKEEFDNRCEMIIYSINKKCIPTEAPFDTLEEKQKTIWELWLELLPEYQISSYKSNKLNGSAVKLLIKGRKIESGEKSKPRAKAERRAIERFNKTHKSIPWKILM